MFFYKREKRNEVTARERSELKWEFLKMRGVWAYLFVDGSDSVKRRKLMTQKKKDDNCWVMFLNQGECLGSRI